MFQYSPCMQSVRWSAPADPWSDIKSADSSGPESLSGVEQVLEAAPIAPPPIPARGRRARRRPVLAEDRLGADFDLAHHRRAEVIGMKQRVVTVVRSADGMPRVRKFQRHKVSHRVGKHQNATPQRGRFAICSAASTAVRQVASAAVIPIEIGTADFGRSLTNA